MDRDYVVKTDKGYLHVNYLYGGKYEFTDTMTFAKRFTERGAKAIITKLNLIATVEPFSWPEPDNKDELLALIDKR